MNIDVRTVKAALRSVWAQCQLTNPAQSLRAALEAKSVAQSAIVQAGPIKQTSGNGQHTTLDTTGEEAPTMQQLGAMWEFLIEKFDDAYALLGGQPTDAQVKAKMDDLLRPVFGQTSNWMYLAK